MIVITIFFRLFRSEFLYAKRFVNTQFFARFLLHNLNLRSEKVSAAIMLT